MTSITNMLMLWSFIDRVRGFDMLLQICLCYGHLWIGLGFLTSITKMLILWPFMDRVRGFDMLLQI